MGDGITGRFEHVLSRGYYTLFTIARRDHDRSRAVPSRDDHSRYAWIIPECSGFGLGAAGIYRSGDFRIVRSLDRGWTRGRGCIRGSILVAACGQRHKQKYRHQENILRHASFLLKLEKLHCTIWQPTCHLVFGVGLLLRRGIDFTRDGEAQSETPKPLQRPVTVRKGSRI
jgi:hypothetical protein